MASYDENAEVSGKYIASLIEASGEVSSVFQKKTREMFEETVGGEIDPEGWYSVTDIAETYHRIQEDVGAQTMKHGGKATVEDFPYPDDLSLSEALEKLVETNQGVYRNSDMEYPGGTYLYEIDGRSARLAVDEAYPLPELFAEGVYAGMIEKFGPDDAVPAFEEVEPEGNEQYAWEATW